MWEAFVLGVTLDVLCMCEECICDECICNECVGRYVVSAVYREVCGRPHVFVKSLYLTSVFGGM